MSDRTVDEDGATAMERWNPASLYAPNDFSQVVRVGKGVPGSTVFVSGSSPETGRKDCWQDHAGADESQLREPSKGNRKCRSHTGPRRVTYL